jgi:tRNA modification GTPase
MRRGALGPRGEGARKKFVAALAQLEGALDFPEDVGPDVARPSEVDLRGLSDELGAAARSYRRPLGEVPEVVLLGRVNAGKSSLLNRLVGRERALVDEAAGTTRDLIEAELELPRLVVRLVDTAGEREEATGVEARGQALARARRKEAALAVVVVDAERGVQPLERALALELEAESVPVLVVENKIDRARGSGAHLGVSALTGEGLDALRAALEERLALPAEEHALGSARQAEAFGDAARALTRAADALRDGADDAAAVELRRALYHLGQITGETASVEVLDAIFARFCIGK